MSEMSEKRFKTVELLETKADEATGTFEALVSVFGNVDKGGDRMMQGSFTNTLQRWRESGKPIPVIVSHQWDNLKAWVGKADPRAIFETERGLMVQGTLDMDDDDARKVHKLMKDGLLTGWSFGYSVPKGGQKRKGNVNEVFEVDLFEVGPTLVGMNPEAQLQSVKNETVVVETEAPPEEEEDGKSADLASFEGVVALDEIREELQATKQELAELREEHQELQKASEERRNEEPARAKSPPDPLREESRKAVLAVMRDGVPAHIESPEPEPEPEPEIDIRDLRQESRRMALSVLKGGLDGQ